MLSCENGECECVKVEIVRKREGVEVCHFPDYGASPFLQDLKRSGKNVSLGSPVFTKEVVDFIKWYLTPSVITPDSTTDPTKLSFSSSSSLSQNGSPSSFLFSPTQPLKEESEIEKRTFYRPKQGKGEFLQNAIIAANNFGLHCLVYVIAKHIRQILIDSESAAALRDKLDFENDLDLTQEKEDTVWTRNCIQTCEIEPEATEEDLLQSFFRDDILLPSPSPALAHPDITAAKCSFENCSLRFGFSTRKHHCRSCGKIFCATHASKFIRLPEGEGVKVEVGWVSNFFTYVMNFGDTSLSRTCDDCFKRIEEEEMSQSLFEAFGLIGFEISLLNRAMVVSHLWRKAAQKCQGILVNVQYKLSGDTLSLMEKKSLWNNREFFMGHPRWLIQIVRMADLSTESISKEVHRVVRGKKKISCNSVMCQVDFSCDHGQKPHRQKCEDGFSSTDLIQFLKCDIKDWRLRRFAAESLRDSIKAKGVEEIRFFLPLLVESLRYEPLPDPSSLFSVLSEAAHRDAEVRYDLFWALSLRAESNSQSAGRYEALKQLFLIDLEEVCEAGMGEDLIMAYSIYQVFRSVPQGAPVKQAQEILARGLAPYQTRRPPCLFDSIHKVVHFHTDEAKVLDGATKPITIPMTVECTTCPATCKYRQEKKETVDHSTAVRSKRRVIFKYEDVRKDYLVLNIIRLMEYLLRKGCRGLDLDADVVTYRVIPTSVNDGFVEFVEGSTTLRDINMKQELTIQNWLFEDGLNIWMKVEMYRKTMAFWSVVTLLLGVGDRHSCNIMMKPSGALFHIDYGFILGEDPKKGVLPEQWGPPMMRITEGMVGGMSGGWKDFQQLCNVLYLELRKHSEIFFELCQVMFACDPPLDGVEVQEVYKNRLMEQLHQRFSWRLPQDQARASLLGWIEESADNPLPDIIDSVRELLPRG